MRRATTRTNALAALTALALLPTLANAWGFDGHRAIAILAVQRLTPEAAAQVQLLLGEQSMPEISTWADEVRREDAYRWSAPLHYINGPRDAEDLVLDRDCPDARCVVGAVNTYTQVLLNTNAPQEERAEALKWIVHFIGDMHQPLHAGYADDRGGNSITVTFMGDETNLHRLWDSQLLAAAGAEDAQTLADQCAPLITDETAAVWTADMDPLDWADESFDYTRLSLYPDPSEADQLGQDYLDGHIDEARLRIAQAAVRLAAHLNATLAAADEHAQGADDAAVTGAIH